MFLVIDCVRVFTTRVVPKPCRSPLTLGFNGLCAYNFLDYTCFSPYHPCICSWFTGFNHKRMLHKIIFIEVSTCLCEFIVFFCPIDPLGVMIHS